MGARGFNAHNKYMILKHGLKENNVSKTCQLFGISRTTFYQWKRAYQQYGMAGLETKEPRKPQMPNQVSKAIEQEILKYVAEQPSDGPRQIYYELQTEGVEVGETGIYNVLKRHHLTRRAQRVAYSMHYQGKRKGKKSSGEKEQLPLLEGEAYPGYLVLQSLDLMGTFEGIGKVYQYTFFDLTSKFIGVKLYQRKQDIDIWNHFEHKIGYLLKTFNLNIQHLFTEKKKGFLPYILKDQSYQEVLQQLQIHHRILPPEDPQIWGEMAKVKGMLLGEFYHGLVVHQGLNTFSKLEQALHQFVRQYNFTRPIPQGPHQGKTPVEVILERAVANHADLDTLPLGLLTLINTVRGRVHHE